MWSKDTEAEENVVEEEDQVEVLALVFLFEMEASAH